MKTTALLIIAGIFVGINISYAQGDSKKEKIRKDSNMAMFNDSFSTPTVRIRVPVRAFISARVEQLLTWMEKERRRQRAIREARYLLELKHRFDDAMPDNELRRHPVNWPN